MANIFPSNGNAGAGTANPTLGLLQVQLSTNEANGPSRLGLALSVAGNNNPAVLYPRPSARQNEYDWYLTRGQQDDKGLMIDPAGNVEFSQDVTIAKAVVISGATLLRGGVSISQNLGVNGNLTANDASINGALKIKNWEISVPDYVFEAGYRLAALEEVAAFVQAHGHLPEIPPASQIEAEGIDAANMILLLLKKVEELTLHLLRHERQLALFDERLRALEAGARRAE